MPYNDECYPRTYQGDGLMSLSLDPLIARIVERIVVVSATSMTIEIVGQTITVNVQRPLVDDQQWTIRIEHTMLTEHRWALREAGSTIVVADAMPIDAVNPRLPDGTVILAAVEAVIERDAREQVHVQTMRAFQHAVKWLVRGGSLTDQAALAVHDGRASVSYELSGGDVILTLTINAGPDLRLTATDIFH